VVAICLVSQTSACATPLHLAITDIASIQIPIRQESVVFIRRSFVGLIGSIGMIFLSVPIAALALRTLESRAWVDLDGAVVSDAIYLSFITTWITIIITAIFGTPLAYILARWRFRGRRVINVLVELPIVLPPAVAGLALLTTFGRRGVFGPFLESLDVLLPFSTAAVVLAQTFVAAPFYVRAAQIGFQGVSREIEDAARVDGAGGITLFARITAPLAARALSAGIILCWARALGEFGATILFAGNLQGRTQTMPLLIYSILERDIDAAITTGLLLVGLALIALLLSQWLGRYPDDPDIPGGI
jgi:molybdate transport system permease protein